MRVWVGPEAKLLRRPNLWPPSLVVVRRIRANRVRTIIFSAIMTLLPCIGLFILLTGFRVTPSPEFMVALCFVTFLGVPVCVLKGLEFLLRRIAARSAWECWPLNDAPAAYS